MRSLLRYGVHCVMLETQASDEDASLSIATKCSQTHTHTHAHTRICSHGVQIQSRKLLSCHAGGRNYDWAQSVRCLNK